MGSKRTHTPCGTCVLELLFFSRLQAFKISPSKCISSPLEHPCHCPSAHCIPSLKATQCCGLKQCFAAPFECLLSRTIQLAFAYLLPKSIRPSLPVKSASVAVLYARHAVRLHQTTPPILDLLRSRVPHGVCKRPLGNWRPPLECGTPICICTGFGLFRAITHTKLH